MSKFADVSTYPGQIKKVKGHIAEPGVGSAIETGIAGYNLQC